MGLSIRRVVVFVQNMYVVVESGRCICCISGVVVFNGSAPKFMVYCYPVHVQHVSYAAGLCNLVCTMCLCILVAKKMGCLRSYHLKNLLLM